MILCILIIFFNSLTNVSKEYSLTFCQLFILSLDAMAYYEHIW